MPIHSVQLRFKMLGMRPRVQADDCESLGVSLGLLRRLVDRGNPYAMTKFARMQLQGWVVRRDPRDAIALLRHAARQGWGPAARLMGGIFQLGLHGVPKNEEAAIFWYRKSVELDPQMKRRYRGLRGQGATLLMFPESRCLATLPLGHGSVLWEASP